MSDTSSVVAIRSSRPPPIGRAFNIAAIVGDLWQYRDLMRQFTRRDIESRHKGTNLGMFWAVLNPLLTLAIYTLIFTQVFPSTWGTLGSLSTEVTFVLEFFCGYVVYGVFADTVSRAPGMVVDKPNLVRKVIFPLEVLAPAALLSSLFFAGIGAVILLAVGGVGGVLSKTLYLFPLVLVPLCLLTMGLTWMIAAVGVYIRDTRQVVPVVMQLLFFITPVLYKPERLPEKFRWILHFNPLTPILDGARATLLESRVPDVTGLAVVAVLSLVVMQAGYACFSRGKRGFADVI